MSDKPISPLRQRMIDDMTARRFKEKVQKDYVRHVRNFAAFLGRSPDTATSEGLRRFQLHMAKQQVGAPTINSAIAALRFFFTVTLERPDLVRPLRVVNEPRKAPVVLSPEEVARLLEAAPGLKYKAALSVAYGAGLRVSEVANLKVSDIDRERMTLRVEQGKGQRDRTVMLSPRLLELSREKPPFVMARQTSLHHRSNQTRNRHGWRCLAERKLRLRVRQYGERYLWFESISLRHDFRS